MALPANRLGPDPRVSSRRAARLYRLLLTLSEKPRSRTQLIRMGRAGMRTFYRDLTFLEACKVDVQMSGARYKLVTPLKEALQRLPFPTPELTFADAIELAKGKGTAHKKFKAQLAELTREKK